MNGKFNFVYHGTTIVECPMRIEVTMTIIHQLVLSHLNNYELFKGLFNDISDRDRLYGLDNSKLMNVV